MGTLISEEPFNSSSMRKTILPYSYPLILMRTDNHSFAFFNMSQLSGSVLLIEEAPKQWHLLYAANR
jgi:hypothetical protein